MITISKRAPKIEIEKIHALQELAETKTINVELSDWIKNITLQINVSMHSLSHVAEAE